MSMSECGKEITPEETKKGEVISCKKRGCETIWVSMNLTFNLFRKLIIVQYHLECVGLEYSFDSWTCGSCKMREDLGCKGAGKRRQA